MGREQHVDTIRQLCRFSETHGDEPLGLVALGRRTGMSPAHLQRVFKKITGISPRQYARGCKLDRLKARLRNRETVTRATVQAGFGSSSRLYEAAGEQLGMTPGTYRDGATQTTIGYTIADCPLGRL